MPAMVEMGRARLARPRGAPALYPMCAATAVAAAAVAPPLGGDVDEGGGQALVCAELPSPPGAVLLLTRTRLRCLILQRRAGGDDAANGAAALWEVRLANLLLVQQRGCQVQMLALAEASATSVALPATSPARDPLIVQQQVSARSEEDAARLHELLRLAAHNAHGVLTAVRRPPLVRASVLLR